jgi:hypothetical protein
VKNLNLIREANECFRKDAADSASRWPKAHIISVDNSGNIEHTIKIIENEIERLVAD